ncbi:hypothetical protein LPJ81_004128, partial [Coemansia sp. IMI 209127]
LQSKFDRVQRPIFLDRMVVADLDIGDNAPVLTNPRLESFDANGQIDASMFIHYMGGFKVVLNTSVKIGSLRLSIALSVVLESLAGKMLVRFHPAPSNRVWVGFYEMPRLRLKLSPVFMQKQVRYAVISQAIEKQIYDILRTTMVLPNMDDTVFFPTPHDDGGILEGSLKDFKDAGLDEQAASDDDSEQTADANRSSSSAARSNSKSSGPAPADGLGRKVPTRVKSATDSDHQSVVETLQSQTKQRPLSFPFADTSNLSPHPSESAAASIKSDIPHARRGSVGGSSNSSSNSINHEGILPPHDALALRKQMVTPKQFSGATAANSSSESLERFRQQLRDNREKLRDSDTESTKRSLSPTPSMKSSISASAASFFKRAKDSQAAESAKTWWQSIQNSTPANNNAIAGNMLPAKAATFQSNDRQQGDHDTPNVLLELDQPVLPRLPPRAAGELMSSSSYNNRMTSGGSENSVAESSSNGLVFPRLVTEPSGANAGGGESSSGATSGSNIVYGGRPIVGSAVTGDSSLMRRRPAALAMGEEIALPIHRRYSNSAKPGFAAASASMYSQANTSNQQ